MLNNQEMNEFERSLQEMQREFNRISNIIMIMDRHIWHHTTLL